MSETSRRVAAIFGETLPNQTRDDQPDERERDNNERWLKEQVPPHHGKA
jgi:hypothetical protein